MNAKSVSLALLLLAGLASSAIAQEREPRGRGNLFQRPAPEAAQAPQPPQARPAPEARRAPEARTPRNWPVREHDRAGPRARELPSAEGARRDWRRGESGRRDWSQDRDGRPDRGRTDQGRGDWDRGGRDRVDGHRVDRDRTDRNRPGEDRRWRDDERRDRDLDRGRNWDRDRHVRPDRPSEWRSRRYPPTYNSPHRYRGHVWRAPPGYYVRSWRFGEYLPRGWYEPSYRLTDWWAYDLPEPPYGYEWVRVGSDVLLVDIYTGRIVQVVRLLFW